MNKLFKILSSLLIFVFILVLSITNIYAYNHLSDTSNYDTLTKKTQYDNSAPAITILTHGQGCSATAWSNYNGTLVYDELSLIERLRESSNADVYRVIPSTPNTGDTYRQFDLKLLTKGTEISGTSYYYYNETNIPIISDFSKHIIVIFEAYDPNAFHEVVYEELNSVIDTISYDYLTITGKIPKINLIGHSRGGLINLIYATNHPYNVSNLISMGTPYQGSALGKLEGVVNALGLTSSITCDSGTQIQNVAKQNELINNWNTMLSSYPDCNINALAIGSCTSVDFVATLIDDGHIRQELFSLVESWTSYVDMANKICDALEKLSVEVLSFINENPSLGNGIVWIGETTINLINCLDENDDDTDRNEILEVLNNCYIEYGTLVLYDDLFIDYDSQTSTQLLGFNRGKKIFTSINCDYSKVSLNTVPVPHNLETRDNEIILTIIDNLDDVGFGTGALEQGTVNLDQSYNIVSGKCYKYIYTPQYSTTYKITSTNKVFIYKDDNSQVSINNDLVSLQAGVEYKVYVFNSDSSSSSFKLTYPSLNDFSGSYVMSSNEEIYIDLQNGNSNICKFSSGNANITIQSLDFNFNATSSAANTMTFNSNHSKYLKITNSQSTNQTLVLDQTTVNSLTLDQDTSVDVTSYYNYYKFTASLSEIYIFDIDSDSSSFAESLLWFDSNFNQLNSISIFNESRNTLYSISLLNNEVVYIGIKNSEGENANATINVTYSDYSWVVDGVDITSNSAYVLNNETDYVKVSYKVNGELLPGFIDIPASSSAYLAYSPISDYEYKIFVKPNAPISVTESTNLSFEFQSYNGEYVEGEFVIYVDPYFNLQLENSNVYDYNVKITDTSTFSSGVTYTVQLKIHNTTNNNVMYKNVIQSSFSSVSFVPDNKNFKAGVLYITINYVTLSYNGETKNYYPSSNAECFSSPNANVNETCYIKSGLGTEVSPYLISTARELTNIREFAIYDSYYDEYYISGYFKQTASITLSGSWTPIPYSFKGEYDGNNKYIYNLTMNIGSSTNYYGIFKSLTGATISNMIFSKVTVNNGTKTGNVYIGAISGYASTSTITNCKLYGTNSIALNYNNYKSYIGGLIGFVQHSAVSSCSANSTTSIYGYGYIGGIVGSSYSSDFSSCINYANLYLYWDGSNSNYAGGIVAYASNSSTFTSCSNYGTIKFAGSASDEKTLTPYIGQIVGYIDSTTTYSSCGCYGDSDPGNLTKVGGFLGIGRTDQAMYVSDEECGYEA